MRDFLLGNPIKDIDLATSASTSETAALFDRVIPLGQRFGSVVVLYQNQTGEHLPVEVTTFREDGVYVDGRRPETIQRSSPQIDAQRRDFTINGLFYDPLKEEIIDYVEGQKDLENRLLRAIGDPDKRFEEDRLRMLRAVRFMSSFDLKMDHATEKALVRLSGELYPKTSIERVSQEIEKMESFSKEKSSLFITYSIQKGLFSSLIPSFKAEAPWSENLQEFIKLIHELPLPLQVFALYLWQQVEENHSFPGQEKVHQYCDFWKCSRAQRRLYQTVTSFLDLATKDPHISARLWIQLLLQAGLAQEIPPLLDRFATIAIFFARYSIHDVATKKHLIAFSKKWPAFYAERSKLLEKYRNKEALISAKEMISMGIPQGPEISRLQEMIFTQQMIQPNFSYEEAVELIRLHEGCDA